MGTPQPYRPNAPEPILGEDFPPAFEQALDSGVPAVLDLKVDPEAILPHATLSEVRQQAQTN